MPADQFSDTENISTPETIPNSTDPISEEELQQEVDACLANPDHPIGKQVSDQFPETGYVQIMEWFCSGFEFEDILTALQTAEISDFDPDLLLTMLEFGQTWEEIWAEIGLN